MIIGTILTILLGGGLAAVGTFLLGYLGFWACAIVLVVSIFLGITLYQNHVPTVKKKHRRAEDKKQ